MSTSLMFRLMAVLALSAVLLPAQNTKVSNNVAPWTSEARKVGHADGNSRILITVYLKLSNESDLQTLVRNIYTPGSPDYRHFLTPEQFRAAWSPKAADVAAVKAFLSNKNFKVEHTPANSIYVDASASISQAESVFGVTENLYSYKGKTLRANAEAPSIPASLGSVVAFIGGLDQSQMLFEPRIRTGNPNAGPGLGYSTPPPCSTFWGDQTGSVSGAGPYSGTQPWVPCGYTPAQIRAAYGIDQVTQTGRGVRVGITDAFASPTIVDDVNRFSAHYGLPLLTSSNFQQVVVPGNYNFPENRFDPAGWYGEESLDIEWVHAIAPDASIIYAGGQNSNPPLDHALIHLIDSGQVDIITNSWGLNGEAGQFGFVNSLERAFLQAAAQGISVLFSSGDDGDVAALRGVAMASWPASSPYVTAVGGTSLGVLNPSGAKVEWGWGTYFSLFAGTNTGAAPAPWPPEFQYGSGGGPSLLFAQPPYQQGIVGAALATSTVDLNGNAISLSPARRVVPDISMNGDPNTGSLYGQTYDVSHDLLVNADCTPLPGNREYCERRVGGTSLSSPMFAGVLALVNQARHDVHAPNVGFANPALYGLSGASGAIRDVLPPASAVAMLRNRQNVSGGLESTLRTVNSTVTAANTLVPGADTSLRTTPGYDNVTGLGTPNVPALIVALGH